MRIRFGLIHLQALTVSILVEVILGWQVRALARLYLPPARPTALFLLYVLTAALSGKPSHSILLEWNPKVWRPEATMKELNAVPL